MDVQISEVQAAFDTASVLVRAGVGKAASTLVKGTKIFTAGEQAV